MQARDRIIVQGAKGVWRQDIIFGHHDRPLFYGRLAMKGTMIGEPTLSDRAAVSNERIYNSIPGPCRD
jgi:hypothetical protein